MVQRHETTEVRQKQIIDAARKLVIRRGSEHVTVRSIAKEVGFSEGAIYRHFKSKKDILSLLVDHMEDVLIGDITASGAVGDTPLEILDLILRSHLSAIEQRRGVSFQVVAEIVSLGDKKLNKKVYETINKYIGHLRALLAEGVRVGQVREDVDLDAAATLLFGMIQGLVNIWALSNYIFNPQERYASLWTMFRDSIARR